MHAPVLLSIPVGARQLLIFPKGNRPGQEVVSLFVKCVLPHARPSAVFRLTIVNDNHAKTIYKGVPPLRQHVVQLLLWGTSRSS